MDRLTKRGFDPELGFCAECDYHGEPNGCNRARGDCSAYTVFTEAYTRLAAYEDTGLTPDEIAALRAEVERLRAADEETCTLSEVQDFDGSVWTCSKCNHVFGYSGEPPYECCPFCGKRIEQYIGYDDPENPDYEDIDDASDAPRKGETDGERAGNDSAGTNRRE